MSWVKTKLLSVTRDECPKCNALCYTGGYCPKCGTHRPSGGTHKNADPTPLDHYLTLNRRIMDGFILGFIDVKDWRQNNFDEGGME